jgi:hypothetical protein
MASETNILGRPSKYKEAYCSLVIEEMTQGKSLTAFAAEIGVSRDTITEWCAVHPEFSVAVKKAKAKCLAWWEERGRNIALSGGGTGSATLAVFGMKNMGPDDWKDKHEFDGNLGVTINVVQRGSNNKPTE